jgi:hypothetical protein
MRPELPKQNNYEVAFSRAAERLRHQDSAEVCARCGVSEAAGGLIVPYLGGRCAVRLPEVNFDPEELPMMEKILILHYLTGSEDPAGGIEQRGTGEYISYKNMPGAAFYNRPYRKRGTERILRAFGQRPHDVVQASSALGGVESDMGDVSVRFLVFPKIEAVLVLYHGDEEFPPEAEILYRDDVARYLSLEDVAVLSGVLASRLTKGRAAPAMRGDGEAI